MKKNLTTNKIAIIIGAGPAGLTAAYELITRTDIIPIILEKDSCMGGLARTVNYHGNRMDIGGHRFFSKSDRVLNWWLKMMPIKSTSKKTKISYHQRSHTLNLPSAKQSKTKNSSKMLILTRKSRIYFLQKLFPYPLKLNPDVLKKLGLVRSIKIIITYLIRLIKPIKPEKSLRDFYLNRFGSELYQTFFKSYTEKVWGQSCNQISSHWGAQRIKGLSLKSAITHNLKKIINPVSTYRQKQTEPTLIEKFLYPQKGPGQMWETVATKIKQAGGVIHTNHLVDTVNIKNQKIISISARNTHTQKRITLKGKYFFSTMPVKLLISSLSPPAPAHIKQISQGLPYRNFITIGLLLNKLKITDHPHTQKLIKDNWLYIQEPNVKIGRLQIYNNWSPHLVKDPDKVWIGLEYFCNKTDQLWNMTNGQLVSLGVNELTKINIIEPTEVLDSKVIKMPQAYPAYFGTYKNFPKLRKYLDKYQNLYLIGRNGMHKYNNQDHSMLTAMTAVDNIINKRADKSNIWDINTEEEYHEQTS